MKEILLTQGRIALVDDEDYEALSKFKWHIKHDGRCIYAVRKSHGTKIPMHKEILGDYEYPFNHTDHKDGNGLNNQKLNLRRCTCSQNSMNRINLKSDKTSIFKGVHFDSLKGKWKTELNTKGKRYFAGRFTNEIDAAIAYDRLATQVFGEFAHLNLS